MLWYALCVPATVVRNQFWVLDRIPVLIVFFGLDQIPYQLCQKFPRKIFKNPDQIFKNPHQIFKTQIHFDLVSYQHLVGLRVGTLPTLRVGTVPTLRLGTLPTLEVGTLPTRLGTFGIDSSWYTNCWYCHKSRPYQVLVVPTRSHTKCWYRTNWKPYRYQVEAVPTRISTWSHTVPYQH